MRARARKEPERVPRERASRKLWRQSANAQVGGNSRRKPWTPSERVEKGPEKPTINLVSAASDHDGSSCHSDDDLDSDSDSYDSAVEEVAYRQRFGDRPGDAMSSRSG